MKAKIVLLLIASTISFATFSQEKNIKNKNFEVAAKHVIISKDSIITTMTGNVDIKGNRFHFSNADKVVYNRKENILLIYGANSINADSLTVLKGADGKEYIQYKL